MFFSKARRIKALEEANENLKKVIDELNKSITLYRDLEETLKRQIRAIENVNSIITTERDAWIMQATAYSGRITQLTLEQAVLLDRLNGTTESPSDLSVALNSLLEKNKMI